LLRLWDDRPVSDLDELQAFVAVVDSGSFVAAAKTLGLTTSTVSRRLAALEDRLDSRLVERTTRRLHVTEAGRRLHARVAPALREVVEAERAVRDQRDVPRGLLRVTSVPLVTRQFLVPTAARYLELHPDTQVEILATRRLVDLVGEGFDLAVRPGPLKDSSLMSRRLVPGHAVVCASPDYLARRGRPERISDLAEHDCISWRPTGPTWRLGDEPLEVSGRLLVNDPDLARLAALRGVGIAQVPVFAAEPDLRAGRLVALLEDEAQTTLRLQAVWPSSRHLSARVRAFLDLLTEQVARG
jgi:DNA-binding transcriptional LysR family regulator